MEFTQALLIAVGTLGGVVVPAVWYLAEQRGNRLIKAHEETIAKQDVKISMLETKLEKYETEIRQDMERTITGNIALVESFLPLLEQIAEKERIK